MKKTIQFVCSSLIILFLMMGCSLKKSLEPIKFMSYNIHIASPPSILPAFSSTDLPAVADVIARVSPDFVAMQEVDKYTARSGKDSHQAKDIAELTGMFYHFADAVDRSEGVQGVAVLSKYPILQADSYKLLTPETSDGETRSLAVILTEVEKTKVVFMSVHLDHKSDVDRQYQVEQILEYTKKYDEYPIIFGGDFNMKPDNEVFKILEKQFMMVTNNHPLTFPETNPRTTIDFILLNKKAMEVFEVVDYYTVDEQYASDHLPLVLELRFKK